MELGDGVGPGAGARSIMVIIEEGAGAELFVDFPPRPLAVLPPRPEPPALPPARPPRPSWDAEAVEPLRSPPCLSLSLSFSLSLS